MESLHLAHGKHKAISTATRTAPHLQHTFPLSDKYTRCNSCKRNYGPKWSRCIQSMGWGAQHTRCLSNCNTKFDTLVIHTFSFSYIPRCKSCSMNSWPKRSRCIQPLEYALQHSMQHTMLHTRSHFHISDVTVARWTPDLNVVGAFSRCPARTTNWAPRWSASLASLLLRCVLFTFFPCSFDYFIARFWLLLNSTLWLCEKFLCLWFCANYLWDL